MVNTLILIVRAISWILVTTIIIDILLSYFLSPYHPIRYRLDRFVNPILQPIRTLLPKGIGIDFSPFILVVLIQVVEMVFINLISGLG